MRVMGIDPGLRLTGYACLDASSASPTIIEAGVLKLGAGGVSARSLSARLVELDHDLRELLTRLRPQAVAVESLFAHYKHPATAIIMGHARGVVLLAIQQAGLQLLEFKPNLVKKAMTGNGLAKKEQVQRAVQAHFGLEKPPSPPDVADAIAIALCATRRTDNAAILGQRTSR
jgi:crossover junction endodeoxyribonuclease RuvC